MYYRKLVSLVIALTMCVGCVGLVGLVSGKETTDDQKNQHRLQSIEPLNLAVLIQDDVVSQVSNELGVTRNFIRTLPQGSRVMVGYVTA